MDHKDGVRRRRGGRFQPRPTRRFAKPKAGDSNQTPSGKAIPMWLVLMLLIAIGGYVFLDRAGSGDRLATFVATSAADQLSASFALCGDGARNNCVVDGDTFWFRGQKIRITDIDTPELNPPRCEAERVKGEAAKARLLALLNAGSFSLSSDLRDEDRYGRKLRAVRREGQSLGEVLIAEGLAGRWDGARRGCC